MKTEIHDLDTSKGIVDTCPVCGYTDGWHVSFKVEDGVKRIILICPDCHSRFDHGWGI